MNKQKSFTLIELLVVIVIIGILAGVIMISTSSSIDKANLAKLKIYEDTMRNSMLTNLISEWEFDEADGLEAKDTWGNSNGALYNSPSRKTGNDCVSKGCISFTGTAYIDCGNADQLSFGNSLVDNPFTISWWENMTVSNGASHFSKETEFNLRNSNSFRINLIDTSTAGYLRKYFGTPTAYIGQWVFFTITYDGSSTHTGIKAYWNTIEKAGTNESSGVYIAMEKTTNPFLIGRQGSTYLNGLMDEFRIYNTVLSVSQVKHNYIAGLDSLLSNGNISKEEYDERIKVLAYDKLDGQ